MTLTLKNRRLSAGFLSPQPETVKKIQGLAPAIIFQMINSRNQVFFNSTILTTTVVQITIFDRKTEQSGLEGTQPHVPKF